MTGKLWPDMWRSRTLPIGYGPKTGQFPVFRSLLRVGTSKINATLESNEAALKTLLLISLGLCAIGYLGLVLSHVAVLSMAGMVWSLAILVAWLGTVVIGFRRYGDRALWLLLEAPVVLLPFYAVFFVDL